MSITLATQDKSTLRTAAYGAVSLVAAAGDKPGKAATAGTIALTSATGLVGYVLAERSTGVKLVGKSVAELADQVFPALTAAVALLGEQAPAEADNFRNTVLVAIDAAQIHQSTPAMVEMARKITAALDAA
ncbi:hypothetical protein [Nocardia sp. NPDC052566]|uniref:hypothetical protein n=1 Tax=Nocardia sp. NPDC052566 TaxID=3364330 RepID=UPI0037C6234F